MFFPLSLYIYIYMPTHYLHWLLTNSMLLTRTNKISSWKKKYKRTKKKRKMSGRQAISIYKKKRNYVAFSNILIPWKNRIDMSSTSTNNNSSSSTFRVNYSEYVAEYVLMILSFFFCWFFFLYWNLQNRLIAIKIRC